LVICFAIPGYYPAGAFIFNEDLHPVGVLGGAVSHYPAAEGLNHHIIFADCRCLLLPFIREVLPMDHEQPVFRPLSSGLQSRHGDSLADKNHHAEFYLALYDSLFDFFYSVALAENSCCADIGCCYCSFTDD
jgi:hypothetical protein